jgi:YD repeat-containing protein
MKCWLLLVVFIVAISNNLKSQNSIADINNRSLVMTPQSAAFTQYSKVPVSLFTGLPDIKIPLYDIKVDNFDMPIYLSYYARGIQPNSHAGWVGTGWNLFAGAVITRKVNGAPDELIATELSSQTVTCTNCGNNMGYPPFPAGQKLGWYWNHSVCNTSYWTSLYPFSGCTTCPNYIGGVSLANTSATSQTLVNDIGADEFDFSINGMSGAFFMGEDGNWKVRSDNGTNIQIKVTVGPYTFLAKNPCASCTQTQVGFTFRQFVLTTGDGTQYYFGNNSPNSTSDDSYAIEFNRSGPLLSGTGDFDVTTIAMAWHLVKIILPSGKIISFTYLPRVGVQYTYYPSNAAGTSKKVNTPTSPLDLSPGSFTFSSTTIVSNAPTPDASVNIEDPVYLSSINFPEGKLVFNSSASGEQDIFSTEYSAHGIYSNTYATPYNVLYHVINGGYETQILPGGTPLPPGGGPYPSAWFKLNDIELDDYNGNKLKDIVLTYSTQNTSTSRLFLNTVQTKGYYNNSVGVVEPPYTCSYNPGILPGYCSPEVDHWGFYNASGDPTSVYALWPGISFGNSYLTYRSPSSTGAQQCGILTQLNYPTGGFAQFTYEPNKYSMSVNQFLPPPGQPYIHNVSPDSIGGGVRIKQIVSQPDLTSPAITYNYSYLNSSGVSSGVLGMPAPAVANYFSSLYLVTYSLVSNGLNSTLDNTVVDATSFSSNNIFPSQNDDGNIVTYTTVTEQQTSGGIANGSKITTFTNHDNGYGNNPPDAFFWLMGSNQMYLGEYSDRSFERGHVLSEVYKDNSNNTIKTITNSYITASANSSFSKSILTGVTYLGGIMLGRLTAVRNYNFYPALQQTVEVNYPSDHSTNTLTTTKKYSYDAVNGTRNLVQSTITNSLGQLLINNIRYPLDVGNSTATDAFTLGINNLKNMYAIGLPVEKYVQRSNADGITNLRTISASVNSFNATLPLPNLVYQSRIITPLTSFQPTTVNTSGAVLDPSYEPRGYIDNFDAVGNVLNLHKVNGMNQSFQWGYNNEHAIVKVANAANTYVPIYGPSYSTVYGSFVFPPNTFTSQSQSFTVNTPGTINLSMNWGSNPGSNSSSNVSYQLFGPVNHTGAMGTGNTPSPISFTNMPVGSYTLTITPNINGSLANLDVNYNYPLVTQVIVSSTGIKEFFFDGFEENTNASVVTGAAHTGKKYWGAASYTTNFTLPTGTTRNFVIQWWNLVGGIWKFNEQPFTTNITLTGPLDDVRIFPTDAQMTSYTYQPLIGMTSETDPSGKSTTYQYDALDRLYLVRDNDGNIIKRDCYTYNGQATGCPTSTTMSCSYNGSNTTWTITFTSVLTGQVYTYSLPATPSNPTVTLTLPVGNYNMVMNPGNSNGHSIYFLGYSLYGYSASNFTLLNIPITGNASFNIVY